MGYKKTVQGLVSPCTKVEFYYILCKLAFSERWGMKLYVKFFCTSVRAVFRTFIYSIITVVW